MLGAIKQRARRVFAEIERATIPPAALPASVLMRRVVLVGASVSMHWHVDVRYPNLVVRPLYEFDKTPVIVELLSSPPPPDAVIIKECAAYFPGPLAPRKELVSGWLDRLTEAGVTPILATVVPVTLAHARAAPGRLEGILEYNAWVRQAASDRSLALLDLEAPLRVSRADPHLRPELATGDGLHLRRRAYRRHLDPIVAPALTEAFDQSRGARSPDELVSGASR